MDREEVLRTARVAMKDAAAAQGGRKVYVDDPSEVPEGYEAQEGPRGGIFYVYDGSGEAPTESDSGGADDDTDESEGIPAPDPERDIESFNNDESLQEQIQEAAENPNGGFTLQRNLDGVNVFEEDVYWTGLWGMTFDAGEFGADDVVSAYRELESTLDQNSALHLGGYHFPDDHEKGGQIAIDLSVGVKDRDAAIEAGEELNQESVANLAAGDFPETGGDGNSPLNSAEEALEYKETLDEQNLRKTFAGTDSIRKGVDPTFRNAEGDTISASGIVHGARYGLDVEVNDDGSVLIDGERYERVGDDDGSDGDDDTSDISEKLADTALTVLKEWTGPHQGEQGGTYWLNTETGERRYQENKPEPGEGDGDGGELVDVDPDELEVGQEVVVDGEDGEIAYIGNSSLVVEFEDGQGETYYFDELDNIEDDGDVDGGDEQEAIPEEGDAPGDMVRLSPGTMADVGPVGGVDDLRTGDTVVVDGETYGVKGAGEDEFGNEGVHLNAPGDAPTIVSPDQVQGELAQEYDVSGYNIENEAAAKIANGINSGDIHEKGSDGFVGARYIYDHVSSIDDPELLGDLLYAEKTGRASSTAIKYTESHIRAIDEDPDEMLAQRGYETDADYDSVPEKRQGTPFDGFDTETAQEVAAGVAYVNDFDNWAEWNDFMDSLTEEEIRGALERAMEEDHRGLNGFDLTPNQFEDGLDNKQDGDIRRGLMALTSRLEDSGLDAIEEAAEKAENQHKESLLKTSAVNTLPDPEDRREAYERWSGANGDLHDTEGGAYKNWYEIQFDPDMDATERVQAMAANHAHTTDKINTIAQRATMLGYRGEDNDMVTDYAGGIPIRPIEPNEEVVEAIEQRNEKHQEVLNDAKAGLPPSMENGLNDDGTITLYRGVSSKVAGFSSTDSWSTDYDVANGGLFDGQGIMKMEAEPEDIAWMHGPDHNKHPGEKEVVIFGDAAADKFEVYEGDPIEAMLKAKPGFDVAESHDEVAAAVVDDEYDAGMFEEYRIVDGEVKRMEVEDGEVSFHDVDVDPSEKAAEKALKVLKEWTGPHEGEQGGTYWLDTETGERRYQENKPDPSEAGDDDGGEDGADTDDDGDFETVEYDDLEEGMEVRIDGKEGVIEGLEDFSDDGEEWLQEIKWRDEDGEYHATWLDDLDKVEGPGAERAFEQNWEKIGGGRVAQLESVDSLDDVEAGDEIFVDGESQPVDSVGEDHFGEPQIVITTFGDIPTVVSPDDVDGVAGGETLEVNGYDVNTEWEARFAHAIMTDAWGQQGEDGFLNVRDTYLHLGDIDNPELLGDALRQEYETRESVTATKRIESRLRSLGVDPEQYKPEPEPDTDAGFSQQHYESFAEDYELDPGSATPLAEMDGVEPGISSKNMAVQDIEGSERSAFVTQYAQGVIAPASGMDAQYRDEIVCLGEFAKNAGLDGSVVPVAHDDDMGRWTAVQEFGDGTEAEEVSNTPSEWKEKVDLDDAFDKFGVMILGGAYDLHSHNVMVSEEGEIGFHDLDHANGEQHDPDNPQYSEAGKASRTLARIVKYQDWADVPDDVKEVIEDPTNWDEKGPHERMSWQDEDNLAEVVTKRAKEQAKRLKDEYDDLNELLYDPDDGYVNQQAKHNMRIKGNIQVGAKGAEKHL